MLSAKEKTAADIARLGPWFHNLHLPDGTQTAPEHPLGDFPRFKWDEIAPRVPADLTGWRALDIGCNAGYYTFELARRGARVTGIDLDARYLQQARWAAGQFGLEERVQLRQAQVYDLARAGERYDLVLFLGVFYHLRYPMLALDIVAQATERMLVFQTLTAPGEAMAPDPARPRGLHERDDLAHPGWPRMSFLEHPFAGDPTNWWAPNAACVEAMLRSAGMRVRARIDETWVCEPDPQNPSSVGAWNRSEYESALGLDYVESLGAKTRPREGTLERLRG